MQANKNKFTRLQKNTEYNSNGDAVISKKDSWFYEDEWDKYYSELIARDRDSSSRSVVC